MLLAATDTISNATTFLLSLAGLEKEAVKALLEEWHLIYVWDITRDQIATLPILVGLPAALLLERVLGRRRRKAFPPAFWQGVWCKVLNALVLSALLAAALRWVHAAYDTYLPFLQVALLDGSALWAQFLVAFVVGDFVRYVHHRFRHRIPVMWAVHAIHHSDADISPGTSLREHVGDPATASLFAAGPAMLVGADPSVTFWLVLAYQGWGSFTHMDVPLTYGRLGRYIVSPAFHRVHHSAEPRHWDKNFGDVLTIWDRMFGTAYFSADEQFECGVAGYAGAVPASNSLWDQWKTWAWLTIRPVRDIYRGAWRSRSRDVYEP